MTTTYHRNRKATIKVVRRRNNLATLHPNSIPRITLIRPSPTTRNRIMVRHRAVIARNKYARRSRRIIRVYLLTIINVRLQYTIYIRRPMNLTINVMNRTNNILYIGLSPSARYIQDVYVKRFTTFLRKRRVKRERRNSTLTIKTTKENIHSTKFYRNQKSIRTTRRAQGYYATNVPRQSVLPVNLAKGNVNARLRYICHTREMMVGMILIGLSTTPLRQRCLLTRRRPPMRILPNESEPSLQRNPRNEMGRTRPNNLLLYNRNFRRRQNYKGPPLDNTNNHIIGNSNSQPLTQPSGLLPNRQIDKAFNKLKTKTRHATYRRYNTRHGARRDTRPGTFRQFPSSTPRNK